MSKLIIKFAFVMAVIADYGVVNATSTNTAPKKDSPGCSGGICPLPATGAPMISVVSPVPESAVPPMAAAPRLKSLNGKTIALVGGSFMANVTHPELKRLILAEFPTAKVYLLSEIGSAGPWPRPGVVRREKDEFQRKLREFKIDAVISGNGGCGLCTPKETGSCIAAEALGIPSVMIAAPGFVKQAKSAAASAGLTSLCVAEYPGAFASHTREELLTEGVARDLSRTYSSKDALCRAVEETARIPLGSRTFANYWGNPGSAFNPETYSVRRHAYRIARKEGSEETPTPPWLAWTGAEYMETVPAMAEGKSTFLVTGDPSRNKELPGRR